MTDTENMRLQADLAMANEKVVELEKQVSALQTKLITGSQLVQAQALRADNKTKADIATLVGVDHRALADLLGGVDTIIAKATAGTYTEAQYNELKMANDEVVRSLQEKSDMLSQLQAKQPE